MRSLVTISAIFLTTLNVCFAQTNIDSLLSIWNDKGLPDSVKYKAVLDAAKKEYIGRNNDSAVILCQWVADMSHVTKDSSWWGKALVQQATANRRLNKLKDARRQFEKASNIYESLHNDFGLGQTALGIGTIHYLQTKFDSSLIYYNKVLQHLPELNTETALKLRSNAYTNIGNVHYQLGNYDTTVFNYFKALEAFKSLNDSSGQARLLGNIGLIKSVIGEYEESVKFLNRCIAIRIKTNDFKGVAKAQNSLGGTLWRMGELDSAIKVFTRILESKDVLDIALRSNVQHNIGIIQASRGDYSRALDNYYASLKLAEELSDTKFIAMSWTSIGSVYLSKDDNANALQCYMLADSLFSEIEYLPGQSGAKTNIGNAYDELGQFEKALEYHHCSLSIGKELRDTLSISRALTNIANVQLEQGSYTEALQTFEHSLALKKMIGTTNGIATSYYGMESTYRAQGNFSRAIQFGLLALNAATESEEVELIRNIAFGLYTDYKAVNNLVLALQMHEMYTQMNDSVNSERSRNDLIRHEFQYSYDKKALTDSIEFAKKDAIKDLEIEKQQANISRQRIGLAATGGGLFLIILLAVSIYRGKQESDKLRKQSDDLLLNILPSETAKELKEKGYADAKQFDQVTVLFSDFKGFTQISERLSATELVAAIDECFKAFDDIMTKYGIEKIKTIGDAYMAAGGLPVPNQTKPEDVVKAALDMRDWMLGYKERKGENGFEIRIGVHTGPVVAGIVGVKKFQYDIWGDTVNTASRMESSGEVGKVNISEATHELLKDDIQFSFESRGKIAAKGKGEMEMYFVEKV